MEILIKDTQQIVTDAAFRSMHPNTSFPQVLVESVLADFNAVAILEGPQVTPSSPYEYSMRSGIEEINGKWFTKYSLGPIFTDNELESAEDQFAAYKAQVDLNQSKQIRAVRDQLLKDTDWTQVADAPVDKAAYAEYRQQLRDITLQDGFPFNIVFPTI